jgi:hypothetical protein
MLNVAIFTLPPEERPESENISANSWAEFHTRETADISAMELCVVSIQTQLCCSDFRTDIKYLLPVAFS